jgi:hypothetical protein
VNIKKCMGCKEPWPEIADEPDREHNTEDDNNDEDRVSGVEAMEVDSEDDD